MICENCATEIRKGWKFCPECGTEIAYDDVFASFGNILRSITSEMEKRGAVSDEGPVGIEIDIMHAPRAARSAVRPRKQLGRFLKSKAIEPKTVMKNLGDRFVVEMDLPGVAEDDVVLTEQQESLEIRARSKKAAYFKIVPIPQGFSQLDQHFHGGKLTLEFS